LAYNTGQSGWATSISRQSTDGVKGKRRSFSKNSNFLVVFIFLLLLLLLFYYYFFFFFIHPQMKYSGKDCDNYHHMVLLMNDDGHSNMLVKPHRQRVQFEMLITIAMIPCQSSHVPCTPMEGSINTTKSNATLLRQVCLKESSLLSMSQSGLASSSCGSTLVPILVLILSLNLSRNW